METRLKKLVLFAYFFKKFISDFYYSTKEFISDFYYSTKEGIKNFWKYRKIIWDDRWWDYLFLRDLIEFKLKDMKDNWKFSHYVDYEREEKTLQELLELLDEWKYLEDEFQSTDLIRKQFFDKLSDNFEKFWD